MSALAVEDVDVAYGRRSALEGVSFEVPPGRLVGVIGPNGAGKSTLFKAILGVLPHSGRVHVAGGRAAYVPQGDTARLDLPVTVLDVALMGRFSQTPWWRPLRRADRRAARESLGAVGLRDLAGRQVGELSGGQRQRAFLARALAQGGEVMLLDEPLTGVDATSRDAILGVLARLRDEGRAILVATHDLHEAARTCDLLLFLNRRVVAYGTPEETFTAEVLAGTYGGELVVVDGPGGRPLVLDDASHHEGHDAG
jgi:ABC-type Mn2+/Zn2+ transport system ATPase subunit